MNSHKTGARILALAAAALSAWLLCGCSNSADDALDAPAAGTSKIAATLPTDSPTRVFRWRAVYRGVEHLRLNVADPRPLKLNVIRVDLHEPSVRFLVTPALEPGVNKVLSQKTTSFLRAHQKDGCRIAINAAPFEPVVDSEGLPMRANGLALSDGDLYSPAGKSNGALLIGKTNRVVIRQGPTDVSDFYNGAGGFQMLVVDGKNIGKGTDLAPRTAAGVTKDGRYLLLLTIDGRQTQYSEGATAAETGAWLVELGAWSALNLDGGGSTALAMVDEKGEVALLNRPIHRGFPGNERPVGSHVGIFAQGLGR